MEKVVLRGEPNQRSRWQNTTAVARVANVREFYTEGQNTEDRTHGASTCTKHTGRSAVSLYWDLDLWSWHFWNKT
ncbi:hypothetical protein EMIHUDRAFT_218215 [Emiliania huxleyi CCMP1516]|uniref:Uncharacterized protein n=2 Tax=Emiliania huxleyi TaxID=2903 RepID=A0A0D3I8V8_EMIH1|nr:hypothetical protein EMIHUDRAFT_218215 [Emiliania huxleyi CCMP1516]EOD07693.1 hypothetical protein EMIHUDRAFT_218215 [Emiliania huxleyi CCMP1516]|eukprot:XP_005760122.1 hypothetical protein EMIHUDRAFT_218215 [Emiliania huxleyi CCMP1516]